MTILNPKGLILIIHKTYYVFKCFVDPGQGELQTE